MVCGSKARCAPTIAWRQLMFDLIDINPKLVFVLLLGSVVELSAYLKRGSTNRNLFLMPGLGLVDIGENPEGTGLWAVF